jgi:hypothetical protein
VGQKQKYGKVWVYRGLNKMGGEDSDLIATANYNETSAQDGGAGVDRCFIEQADKSVSNAKTKMEKAVEKAVAAAKQKI